MSSFNQLTGDICEVIRKTLPDLVGEILQERLKQAAEDERNVAMLQSRLDHTAAELRSERLYRTSEESKYTALKKQSDDIAEREKALLEGERAFDLRVSEFKLKQTQQVRDFLAKTLDRHLNAPVSKVTP